MQSKYEQKNPCTLGVEISSLVFISALFLSLVCN
jgi:hypothetical protein